MVRFSVRFLFSKFKRKPKRIRFLDAQEIRLLFSPATFISSISVHQFLQINAATTTQLLLGLFKVEGVVHYGIAGNANPSLIIGDVAIPRFWAHSALWNWQVMYKLFPLPFFRRKNQFLGFPLLLLLLPASSLQRYGDGPENELPFESSGDYTRKYGFLKFADYTSDGNKLIPGKDNLLNNVWYQPEEIFPVDGTPEERQNAFWVPVDPHYFAIAKKLVVSRVPNLFSIFPYRRKTNSPKSVMFRKFSKHKFKFLSCSSRRLPLPSIGFPQNKIYFDGESYASITVSSLI